jgi:putative DNA primase/helicase
MTLPAPLAFLGQYRRFLNYTLETDPDRPGKTMKRPTDVRTGRYCNSNLPEHQYSYEEAAATGRPIGFVFHRDDKLFFGDADSAYDGTAWSSIAQELCKEFAGAYVEVSQSGTGLHIIGRYTDCPPHASRNITAKLELYTHQRFCALTFLNCTGDAGTDHTAALTRLVHRYFPHNAHGETAGWSAEPVPEWDGPADDAELLRAAMASGKKSTAAAFGDGKGAVTFSDLFLADRDKLAARYPDESGNGGYNASSADAALAAHLAHWTGKNCERIRRIMLQSGLARPKWDDRPEWLETTIMKACAFVKNVATGHVVSGPLKLIKPVIVIRASQFDQMATEAERALIDARMPIYQRGELVTPVVNDATGSGGHQIKVVRLAPMAVPAMLDYLCRSAQFKKWTAKQELVAANPPENLAKIILARAGEWNFRHLAGIITAPTLRPDGSLLTEPGYDALTRLLVSELPAMAAISECPTREEAAAALAKLNGLLSGFNFADGASRAVALSALISPVVRGAMPVVPLHAITAPTSGSGKTYLVDIVSALLTGERAPVLSAAHKEEETEKRLHGAVLDGSPIIVLDNINGELYSDFLCQAVERPRVKIRPLGTSQVKVIETRATFFATGNNLRLVSDLSRRTITCTLEPGVERPELRTFDTEPLGMVLANRGEYLAAALTVVRAFIVAGKPGRAAPLGSFQEWSDLVRSALMWLDCADPVATQEGARADDPTITELSTLLTEWHAICGSNRRTARDVIEAASPIVPGGISDSTGLRDALLAVAADDRGGIDGLRLGKYLSNHKGRILAGLRFASEYDKKRKQNVWCVVAAGPT